MLGRRIYIFNLHKMVKKYTYVLISENTLQKLSNPLAQITVRMVPTDHIVPLNEPRQGKSPAVGDTGGSLLSLFVRA
jgi:hypothetical protein